MKNITIIDQVQLDGSIVQVVIIDKGNDEFTCMDKSVYDEQQVEHLTEIPTPDEA